MGGMRNHASQNMSAGDVAFGITAAFLFGIFAANSGWNVFLLGVMGAVIALAVALVQKKYFAAIFLAAGVAGALYYYAYVSWQAAHTYLPSGKGVAFFGILTEAPKPAGKFTMLAVSLLHPYAGTLDIFTFPNAIQFHYCDEIWVSGAVTPPSSPAAGDPPAMFLPHVRVVASHQRFWLKEMVINVEQAIVKRIALALPADQAALLSGILLGTTATIGVALKAQMETSGTTYIVTMYGYKIILITFALAAVLKDRVSRRTLLWITLSAVGVFVFVSGGSVSAIRAAIMGSLAVVARGV